jgi:hypothetical protein
MESCSCRMLSLPLGVTLSHSESPCSAAAQYLLRCGGNGLFLVAHICSTSNDVFVTKLFHSLVGAPLGTQRLHADMHLDSPTAWQWVSIPGCGQGSANAIMLHLVIGLLTVCKLAVGASNFAGPGCTWMHLLWMIHIGHHVRCSGSTHPQPLQPAYTASRTVVAGSPTHVGCCRKGLRHNSRH